MNSHKTARTAGRVIERVLVPLDATSDNHVAIDTAVHLAARAKAPLHGVFVEDEDLLHMAALPFARQVSLGVGAEALTRAQIELHLKAAAERAHRELAAAAKRHHVRSTFEIVRGASERVLADASEGDLVVMGGEAHPIGQHFRMGCRWWAAVEVTPGPFLLVRHDLSAGGMIVVLLRERTAGARRLVEAAAQIAAAADGALTVICPPALAGSPDFDAWLTDAIGDLRLHLQVEIAPQEANTLRDRIAELGCHMLAVEVDEGESRCEQVRELLEHFACDILTVC